MPDPKHLGTEVKCEMCKVRSGRMVEVTMNPVDKDEPGFFVLLFYFCRECLPKDEDVRSFVMSRIKTISKD